MSLDLPANFRSDIQGRDTNLFPVVFIGNAGTDSGGQQFQWIDEPIVVSTNQELGARPILLNMPSLKESIDIEKRNYKISNVTLTLSNAPYNGERFSDIIGNPINRECRIQWASPSGKGLNVWDIEPNHPSPEDWMFYLYFGTIRRYEHDDETVKLVLEDRSQATLHRDLPLPENYLGTDDSIPDKYKNKPIPMVYGHVDKSPCVIASTGDDGESISQLFIDNNPVHSVVSEPNLSEGLIDTYIRGCLYVSDGEGYAHCANIFPETTTLISDIVEAVTPIIEGHPEPDIPPSHTFNAITSYVDANYIAEPSNGIIKFTPSSTNDTGKGILRGLLRRKNLNVTYESHIVDANYYNEIYNNDPENYNFENNTGYIFHADDNSFGERGEGLLNIINGNYTTGCSIRNTTVKNNKAEWAYFKISVSPVSVGYHSDIYFAGVFYRDHGASSSVTNPKNYPHVYMFTNISPRSLTAEMGAGVQWWALDTNNHGGKWFSNVYEFSLNDDGSVNSSSQTNIFTRRLLTSSPPSSINSFGIGVAPYETVADPTELPVNIDVWDANIFHVTYVKDLLSQDFYADVRGRTNESDTLIFKPEDIINDIVTSELKVPTSNIDYESFVSYDNYNLWKHAFTVNKKINSKKLIENIASASPYIPRFDNMGNFKFSTIPQEPTSSDVEIKNDEVIDFSFSRTKIEDVYTKVEFKYNWDYAREEFNSSVESDIEIILPNYEPEYYGFEMPDTLVYDHAESTLIIDDDRGKYIRDPYTAQAFCNWILLWHCNQHLKMKVRLPLKYMEIEIGDMVKFEELLGGIVPYGIDYRYGDNYNGQWFYPVFMVSSTNKTLEWVEIECIQMHTLNDNAVIGCPDINACNYVEGVTISDTCNYPEPYRDCDGNCTSDDDGDGICNEEDECVGNNELPPDCNNVCGGSAEFDNCGICGGNNTTCQDCNGTLNGTAVLDDCGDCLQSDSWDWNGACAGCMYFNEKTGQGADNYHPSLDYTCSMLNRPESYSPYGCCIWENPTIENSVAIVNQFSIETDHNYAMIANDTIVFDDGVENDKLNRHGNVGFDVDLRLSEALEGMELGFNIEILTSLHENVTNFVIQPLIGTPEFEDLSEVINQNSVSEGLIRYYDMDNPMIRLNRDLQTDEEFPIWFQVQIETQGVNEDGDIFVDYHSEWFQIILKVVGGQVGDLNGDGGWNVLDIVTLANCILGNSCVPDYSETGDLNGDGLHNVLDLVTLANCILGQSCGG